MLKRKDMMRTEWKTILEKEYRQVSFVYKEQRGIVSVLDIKKVSAPVSIQRLDSEISIANEGDAWLQIAVENSPVWITAMYDTNRTLQQIYFDITKGNDLSNPEDPTFEDLYLDIVLDAEGKVMVLDRDELESAYSSGIITSEQYQKACIAGSRLYDYLCKQRPELLDFCRAKLIEFEKKR